MTLKDRPHRTEPLPRAPCCYYCVIHHERECFFKVAAVSLERYSHGGDVFTGEGIGGVADQQTGLTHSPEKKRRKEGRRADDKLNKKKGFVFTRN